MAKRRLPHESITEDRVTAMCMRQLTTLDNPGICLACGCEADGCEPDAENYTCEACGESCVMGAEQILIAGFYHPDKQGTAQAVQARGLDEHGNNHIDIEDET